jgi:hypothetical protein
LVTQIAQADNSAEVRAEALRLVQDIALVALVLEKDPDPLVRKTAVERLGESRKLDRVARHDPSPAVRAAATRQIHDQSLLKTIAQTDLDWSVRLSALQRVYEQSVVEELAKGDLSPIVREAATRVVAREDTLRSLARSEEPSSVQAAPVLDSWVITGRLLHEDGSPLSRQKILVLGVEKHTNLPQDCRDCSETPSAETGTNGNFRLELRRNTLVPHQAFTLAIRTEGQLVQLLRNGTPVKLVEGNSPNPTNLGRLTVKPLEGSDPATP